MASTSAPLHMLLCLKKNIGGNNDGLRYVQRATVHPTGQKIGHVYANSSGAVIMLLINDGATGAE